MLGSVGIVQLQAMILQDRNQDQNQGAVCASKSCDSAFCFVALGAVNKNFISSSHQSFNILRYNTVVHEDALRMRSAQLDRFLVI